MKTAVDRGHGVRGEVSYLTVALTVDTLDVSRVEALRWIEEAGSRGEGLVCIYQ